MFERIFGAEERIYYQLHSALAKSLTELCQEALDYADTLPTDAVTQYRKMEMYLKKDFTLRLQHIADKELNITLADSYIQFDASYANAAIWVHFRNISQYSSHDVHDTYSGLQIATDTEFFRKHIAEKFIGAVDLKTGRVNDAVKDQVQFGLVLSPSLFLGKYIFKDTEPLTADEMASILIHEFGHALGVVEHAAENYYRADIFKDCIGKLGSEKTCPESIKTDVEDFLKTAPAGICGDVSPQELAPMIKGVLGPGVVISVAIAAFYLVIFLYEVYKQLQIICEGFSNYKDANTAYKGSEKTSDVINTTQNAAYAERIADELVSRHGMARAYISGSVKYDQYLDHGRVEFAHRADTFKLGQMIIAAWRPFSNIFNLGPCYVLNIAYGGPRINRLQAILQDTLSVFKDINLPKEIRDSYIADIEDIKHKIDTYQSTIAKTLYHRFWLAVYRIVAFKNPITAITTGNLSADYSTLQKLTGGLIRNPLFYQAARIQQLLDKKTD